MGVNIGNHYLGITQPSDVTIRGENVETRLVWNPSFGSVKTQAFKRAQMFVDSEVLRKMDPIAPWRSGDMTRSATRGTVIGSGHIVYNSVYARRQYYEHKTKSRWFETVKAQSLDQIQKGAAKIIESGN